MSFLAPLFLLGGVALAAPIIYHLVRRTTRERMVFSSLMFLLPSPPRLSKRHRFEHILLLILRCLALALLALGFARPFLRQTPIDNPDAAQPKRIAILVDTSASMRREGLWPAARARVEDVLRRAGPADQIALFSFDKTATALMPFEQWNRTAPNDRVAFASGLLGGISPGWAGTHLGNALVTAAEALSEHEDGKAAPGPRQIVLVSDLQAGSRLDALQAYEWPKGVELIVEAVKAKSTTNAGLQLVADAPDSTRAVDAPVRVRVSNAADSKNERFKLGWVRAANEAGAANDFIGAPVEAYVPPGQSQVFAVPLPKASGQEPRPPLEQLALRGDDESFDNAVYFIPAAQQRASILWLGSEAAEDTRQPLFFLQRAFAETPRVAVQVKRQAPSAPLLPNDVQAANAIFVADAVPVATATALREQALGGKTIVLLTRKADAATAAALGTILGGESVRLEEGRVSNYAMMADIDFQHPLFAPFADPRYSDFTKIHFWKYRKLDATSIRGARVVAKFDNGDPALIEAPAGKGRVYVLTSGWQPEDSQLAVSSKFVPLLWSLLEQAGGVATFATQFSVGDAVPVPAASNATSVRLPTGTTVALPGGGDFAQTMQPGIYEFTGSGKPQRFAVNLDGNESRTTPLGVDELEQLGVPVARGKADVKTPVDNKTLLQGIEAENRQKLWRWFIAATLAVLLVESALAGWTARRSTMQTQEVAP